MTKLLTAVALGLVVVLPSVVSAQGKTDFSGTWTFDEAKSDPAPAGRGGGGGGGGGRGGGRMGGAPATAMTIKQTATELSIDRTTAQGNQTAVYKLDGSESKNTDRDGTGDIKSDMGRRQGRHRDHANGAGTRRQRSDDRIEGRFTAATGIH